MLLVYKKNLQKDMPNAIQVSREKNPYTENNL